MISIIIPLYNSSLYIAETIKSVINQTLADLEIIVVDDESIDDSLAIVKSFTDSRIKTYSKINQGASAARNFGLSKAKGEYVLFLDSDDILVPEALEILSKEIGNNDIVFGSWQDFDETGNFFQTKLANTSTTDLIANYFALLPTISTALIKRNNVTWNENKDIWEVTEYFLKCIISKKIKYSEKIVTQIRQHHSKERLTLKHDHFNYLKTANFFTECKAFLNQNNCLTKASEEQLDKLILTNIYGMFKVNTPAYIVKNSFKVINLKLIKHYKNFSLINLYGLTYFGGYKGLRLFYLLNKCLGRI